MRPAQKQLWRVVNASADTILKLQVQYDGSRNPSVSPPSTAFLRTRRTGPQAATPSHRITFCSLPRGARSSLSSAPLQHVKSARLITLNVEHRPRWRQRSLAARRCHHSSPMHNSAKSPPVSHARTSTAPLSATPASWLCSPKVPSSTEPLLLRGASPTPTILIARLISSSQSTGINPVLFSPDNPPAIITTQGAAEDWTIENRAARKPRVPYPPDPLSRARKKPYSRPRWPVPRHHQCPLLVRQRSISQRHASHGFPGNVSRRLRLPLPHPRT